MHAQNNSTSRGCDVGVARATGNKTFLDAMLSFIRASSFHLKDCFMGIFLVK